MDETNINTSMVKVLRDFSDNCRLFVPDINLSADDLDNITDYDAENIKEDLEVFREKLKMRFQVSSRNTLTHKCIRILYQLSCLLLEDYQFSGQRFVNSVVYAEDVLRSVSQVARKSKNMFFTVDCVSRGRSRLAARKRNMRNNLDSSDFVDKMNFLNKWHDLDDSMMSLKELLMMVTIWQQYDKRGDRIREGRSSEDFIGALAGAYDSSSR